jgi:hypothetical protein
VAFVCALGRACADCDAACARVEAARQDYRARLLASSSNSKHFTNFNHMLEERQILLSLWEMNLEVHEAKLAKEQAQGMQPFDG